MPKRHFLRDSPRLAGVFNILLDMKEAVVVLSLLMTLRYLIWRVAETLNTSTPVNTAVSVALVAAEIYGFVSVALFYFQVRPPMDVTPAPVAERDLPRVDVFVTIYNEPPDILYRTLLACAALDYPADRLNIYVLDDGPREAIRALAERFGCRHVTRQDRLHAKAGNVNNGLRRSRGELVLLLDCDHIPVRTILRETVGFFADPKVGFVQMPHHFYNADIFQHNLHLDDELVHEQDLFFQVMQPGRQRHNSVMFAGSSAVLRRAALESIGGIQTACAIEDTHTSMRLQAKGWRGVYHNKILSAALSPESYAGYLTQRMRWTRGGVQLFVLDNPLLRPGLSLSSRLSYFSSVIYFFHGWSRLVFLLSPLSFLIWRCDPIVCGTWDLVGHFLPAYVFSHLAVLLISRECRNPFWSDVYEAASVFALSWTALATLLQPDKLVFNVTPKGEAGRRPHRVHWSHVVPHTALMFLLLAGIVIATRRMASEGMALNNYSLSCLWAAFNVVLLGCAIEGARERPQLRQGHRVHRRLACKVGYHGRRFDGSVTSLSESGCLVRLDSEEHLPPLVRLRLFSDDYDHATGLTGEVTELDGEVVHQDIVGTGGSRVGIRFTDVSVKQRQDLLLQMFSAPGAWDAHERPFVSSLTAFWHIGTSLLRPRLRKPKRMRRARARIAVDLEGVIESGRERWPARLRDLSVTGARIVLPGPAEVPERFIFTFAAASGTVAVECRRVRQVLGEGRPPECGLKFLSPGHLHPRILEDLEDAASG